MAISNAKQTVQVVSRLDVYILWGGWFNKPYILGRLLIIQEKIVRNQTHSLLRGLQLGIYRMRELATEIARQSHTIQPKGGKHCRRSSNDTLNGRGDAQIRIYLNNGRSKTPKANFTPNHTRLKPSM